jgi:hypothetical protein
MKYLFLPIIILISVVSFYSCENADREAGCDVNGVWLGHWQIDGGDGGTFITPVSQADTRFEGNIFIWFDLPSLENHGVDFSGRIIDRTVRCNINISGVDINVNGDVSNDSTVRGNFEVSLGFAGTYQGRKIRLSPVEITEVYKTGNTNNWCNNILWVNDHIWLSDMTHNTIMVIDMEGQLVRTMPENFINGVCAFDGEYIWTYGYDTEQGGDKFIQYDTMGNILNYLAAPTYFVDAIAFDGSQLYYSDNYNRQLYKVNASGSATDSIPVMYNTCHSFVFGNQNIYCSPGYASVIYLLNQMGEIDAAFELPVDPIRSITTDHNGTIWCLTEKFNLVDNGPATSTYTIDRFILE